MLSWCSFLALCSLSLTLARAKPGPVGLVLARAKPAAVRLVLTRAKPAPLGLVPPSPSWERESTF